ncbi:hypothetical protein ICN46_07875 [Polynucleobacter sp. Latsch14-2]|jgi:hypothetical protein|uniref:GlcNAc-transferase family protein n=1 Tax=Polynucleobacter sp. Latsch14-2 TaxID=2576920 RepID=UPI001C0AD5C4|nr:GlcNAc-transferase family protein [Polynucleobacter sp. Latsch14-2]MBU3614811.1 hypothetical protein [Polynucleobacter sp. Latsch14-2]
MKKTKLTAKKSIVKKNANKKTLAPKKTGVVAKKAITKKVVAKKVVAKKVVAKKVAPKKIAAKKVTKKASVKKAIPKQKLTPLKPAPLKVTNDFSGVMRNDGPNTIFVQIASYRDPELVPTILDCIAKAKHPENLRFGICRQFHEMDEFDNVDQFRGDSRFRILDTPWHEALGVCWARSKIQELYAGEKYTLQLDSHHRFVEDWDEKIIEMIGLIDSPKPILSTYCPGYDPANFQEWSPAPIKMIPEYFTPSGNIVFRPVYIDQWEKLTKPIPARFIAGGFFFTIGQHCLECKYDPNIYFSGEEDTLSLRSYTLGYDLYHPHRSLIAHNFHTAGRPKHWEDHDKEKHANILKSWAERNESSFKRVRQVLGEEDSGVDLECFGLGSVRTHLDYEKYAGIDYSERKLHPFAISGFEPPTTGDSDWGKHKAPYKRTVDWSDLKEQLIAESPDQIYIGFDNINGTSEYSEFTRNPLILTGEQTKLDVSFLYDLLPTKLVFFCLDKDDVWYKRLEKSL